MLTEAVIEQAARTLVRAARSPAKVILFGSWASGKASARSDLDFLVIEEDVESRLDEMVRLRDALPPLGVPVDVLVVSQDQARRWGSVRGTMVNAALTEGKVLAES